MKTPKSLEFKNLSQELEIVFDDKTYHLPYEFLRVFSPSAEVKGHSPSEAKLQVGKKGIKILDVAPVGEYAIKITFSDGHDSGLYTWDWLEEIAQNKDSLWSDYLEQLKKAGASRDPDDEANKPFIEPPRKKCPNH